MTLIREALAEARNEIARLEALETEQAALIDQTQTRLRETELQLAETRRVQVLELMAALTPKATSAARRAKK